MKWRILPFFISLCLFLSGCATDSENSTSESSSVYIQNKGSDTIVNLALAWAERYQTLRPDVRLSVTGGGATEVSKPRSKVWRCRASKGMMTARSRRPGSKNRPAQRR